MNIDLRKAKMVGYGCVVVATIEKDEGKRQKQIEATKPYSELVSVMPSPDHIVIDTLTSRQKGRPLLDEIMDDFRSSSRLNPTGVIVIPSIAELGATAKECADNYEWLMLEDIGLFVLDSPELSTADGSWEYCKDLDQRKKIVQNLQQLIPSELKTKRGRKQRNIQPSDITEDFKKVYWCYENYFLPEKETYKNSKISLNKVSFREYCRVYEAMPEYAEDELEQDRKYGISSKPKRFGTVPETFDAFQALLANGVSFEVARMQLGIPQMTETTFARFRAKKESGKKGMAQAAFRYADPDCLERE